MNVWNRPPIKPGAGRAAAPADKDPPKGGETSIRSVAGLLVIGCLFALVGGSLDAYSYLTHDHVFSTAESGNVVLFGVYASSHNWPHAMRCVPPIVAFVLGTAIAKLIGTQSRKQTFRATLICQGLEGAVLFFLTLFGFDLSGQWVVPLLAFCAALQNSSLETAGPWSFNDAMTTGNLRQGTAALIYWLKGRDREKNRGQATVSLSIFFCFLAGALLGGIYTHNNARYALAPAAVLSLVGFVLTWRQRLLNLKGDPTSQSGRPEP